MDLLADCTALAVLHRVVVGRSVDDDHEGGVEATTVEATSTGRVGCVILAGGVCEMFRLF